MDGFGKKMMEKGKWKEHIERLLERFDKDYRLLLLGKIDFERVFTVMHKNMYSTVVSEEQERRYEEEEVRKGVTVKVQKRKDIEAVGAQIDRVMRERKEEERRVEREKREKELEGLREKEEKVEKRRKEQEGKRKKQESLMAKKEAKRAKS